MIEPSYSLDPFCAKCEEVLQQFLDRELTDDERLAAEKHLEACNYCRKRYRFEVHLRRYVRQAAIEPMTPALKAKLAALRTPL
jgi:anti-sigma factor (TIGR02949 family)